MIVSGFLPCQAISDIFCSFIMESIFWRSTLISLSEFITSLPQTILFTTRTILSHCLEKYACTSGLSELWVAICEGSILLRVDNISIFGCVFLSALIFWSLVSRFLRPSILEENRRRASACCLESPPVVSENTSFRR